ncbi:glycosyltransferase [Synechococcus sp. AH-736-G20]|nr:glycosyltransferase [Synechococcus sp. AH-736-G20]
MIVTHFSTFESGGAGRAAHRIHRSLVDHEALLGVQSRMRVIYGSSQDTTVSSGPAIAENPIWRRLRPRLASWRNPAFYDANTVLHSTCWPDSGVGKELASSCAQLIHLHWIGRAGLSIEEVGRLPQPLVWTLHDQWAFLGSEHYVALPPVLDRRFVHGYLKSNRPAHERGPDLNRKTWERKKKFWNQPITIVCPSRWLAAEARSSSLMRKWPIHVIPYPIDGNLWSPVDQQYARHQLGLPQQIPLILFTALSGTSDLRKGADLLQASLPLLRQMLRDNPTSSNQLPELVIVGEEGNNSSFSFPFPVHFRGVLSDTQLLRLHYAASDLLVIPSRQDNLPNTGLEAHACGLPVVGFRIGGLPDIVDDLITGALAEPFEPLSMARAIHWVLSVPERAQAMREAARDRALREWDPARIATSYSEIYRTVR